MKACSLKMRECAWSPVMNNTGGGQLFDRGSYQSTFVASAALLGGAALLAFRASRAVRASGSGVDLPGAPMRESRSDFMDAAR